MSKAVTSAEAIAKSSNVLPPEENAGEDAKTALAKTIHDFKDAISHAMTNEGVRLPAPGASFIRYVDNENVPGPDGSGSSLYVGENIRLWKGYQNHGQRSDDIFKVEKKKDDGEWLTAHGVLEWGDHFGNDGQRPFGNKAAGAGLLAELRTLLKFDMLSLYAFADVWTPFRRFDNAFLMYLQKLNQ